MVNNGAVKRKRSVQETAPANHLYKSPRMSSSVSDLSQPDSNQSLGKRWLNLVGDTFNAFASLKWRLLWRSDSTFHDNGKDISLASSPPLSQSISSLRRSITKSSVTPPSTAFGLQVQGNGHFSPTNLHASSSKSLRPSSNEIFVPPPPRRVAEASVKNASNLSDLSRRPSSVAPKCEDTVAKLVRHRGPLSDGVRKMYKPRNHIYAPEHKQSVAVKRELELQLYEISKMGGKIKQQFELEKCQFSMTGYGADFGTFRDYVEYRRRLTEAKKSTISRASSPIRDNDEDKIMYLHRALARAKKSLDSPRPAAPFTPTLDLLQVSSKAKSELARKRLKGKRIPGSLPREALEELKEIQQRTGVVASAGREQVKQADMQRLTPGQWLNDEIVNFYGQLIMDRMRKALEAKENVVGGHVPKVHYMTSFFWEKLSKQGYVGGRMARWTKKLDIFSLDIILIPINHGNAHWTSAAINFAKKRIEAYDSMGIYRENVFKTLRSYLDDEHKTKKNKPFDFTGWTNRHLDDYPEQENHFDCGVFMCQTLEWLSRGEETFAFTQKDMPYFRQRMTWEIGRSQLGDPL